MLTPKLEHPSCSRLIKQRESETEKKRSGNNLREITLDAQVVVVHLHDDAVRESAGENKRQKKFSLP